MMRFKNRLMANGSPRVSDSGIDFSQIRHFFCPLIFGQNNGGQKNGAFIAPPDKPVLYSPMFHLQMTVRQQPHMSATGRVSTTDKGEDHDQSQSFSPAQFRVDRRHQL